MLEKEIKTNKQTNNNKKQNKTNPHTPPQSYTINGTFLKTKLLTTLPNL